MSFANTVRGRLSDAHPAYGLKSMTGPPRVLLVEDDEHTCRALTTLLGSDGFLVSAAADGATAIAEAARSPPDVVLTNLKTPTIDAAELCRRIREIDANLPLIFMISHADLPLVIESVRAGAEDFLTKPLQRDLLLSRLECAIARRSAKLEREHVRLRAQEVVRSINERLVLSSVREQEHAEAEVEQRAQLSALLENLREGVAIAEPSGRIRLINDAGKAILGLGDKDLPSIDALDALEIQDVESQPLRNEQHPLMRALRGEQFTDNEVQLTRPNGERRRLVSTGTSVKDERGQVTLAFIVFRDVTELRRLGQQRDEWLALVSHDLRNPLSSILVLVSALKWSVKKQGPAEAIGLAERIERNLWQMNDMIEELSEATTFESEGVMLRRVACDLRELVVGVVARMDDARASRISIEVHNASPCLVLADATRLGRVVDNLLTNALKYSAADAPVSARLSRTESHVELEVIDRGIGIAAENVKRLFDRYYRTKAGKAHAGGIGLGLYISRLIVEAHGGRIAVSSEVAKGSTFTLTLPFHRASA
jgi:PAS domain S-box-containing protein